MSSVCRVCLVSNKQLHSVNHNMLLIIYEKITNNKFNSDDARPRALCCFCYQKLLRCHTFSQMAVRSENIFSNFYNKGLEVTHEYLDKQPLSVATTSFVTIDDNATNAGSQVTIKDEPPSSTDIKEDMTTDLEKLVKIESFPEQSTRSGLTFEEDYINEEVDAEELLYKIHVDQPNPDDSKMPYICNNCNQIFDIKSKLISHIKKFHAQFKVKQYSSAKKHTGTTSMIEEKTIQNQKQKFACTVCDKQFSKKSNFVIHMRTHTGEKPFVCNVCEKDFYRKAHLVVHMRIHLREKPFVCNVCDKQFNQKSNLVSHMRAHTGDKPFLCHVCEKRFGYKSSLKKHMIIHTDEKPVSCQVCNKQFIKSSYLVRHMILHTDYKPSACHECGKQYKHKRDLVSHMRTHTGVKPFACQVCNKQFYRKSNLVIHMRTHTGEKPFACQVCDKQFTPKFILVTHMRTHTGVKPSMSSMYVINNFFEKII